MPCPFWLGLGYWASTLDAMAAKTAGQLIDIRKNIFRPDGSPRLRRVEAGKVG